MHRGDVFLRDIDESLSSYLETHEADEMFDCFFSAIRKAYMAGCKAAGGEIDKEQPILTIVKGCKVASRRENRIRKNDK